MPGTVDVIVGTVVKAHGVRGDVVVESHTDEPSRFAPGAVVLVNGGRRLEVRSARAVAVKPGVAAVTRLVVSFGLSTRDEAERLVGATLLATVPADELPADAAEYFDRHLVGLMAQLPDGTKIGPVTDVLHGLAQDVLVIETPSPAASGEVVERLVPFVRELVPEVDIRAGRVTIVDLPGLLSEEP